jgi:hypothetical protein
MTGSVVGMPEPFTEEEFVVILDHYFLIKEGAPPHFSALSDKLRNLDAIPDPAFPRHHRTGVGLRNVIGRFAAVDPDPPAVLASYAERLEPGPLVEYRRIWDQYAGDPDAVRLKATQLLNDPVSPAGATTTSPFELGRIYNRQLEVHGVYGGQKYGGISTPVAYPLVLIFSGDEGAAYGYADEDLPGGGLLYYGEGQSGDMQMIKGNRAIHDHAMDGKTLHLFKKVRDGFAQYAGEFECKGHELRPNTPDRDGKLRTAIAFKLSPRMTGAADGVPPEVADAVDALTGIARGQGFSQRLKTADRTAIELRAMELATLHFRALGFDVKDVSGNQPYDLSCTKGTERVDVEVKGTTTGGHTVLLTSNEVQHALSKFPRTALAVAREIALHDAGAPSVHVTGGTLEVHQPWRPLDTDLKALGYTYSIPSRP